jgi:DNA primase
VIADSFKQDLLNRIDIVDLIERHVPLKKGGANYIACCPFHSEKSPSFTVSPTKQFYHCFGCGAHGNAISFLMEYQGMGYIEAVTDLAELAGMKMPEFQRTAPKPEGPDLHEILERAARFYREQLKLAPRAIDYLKQRGLTGKIAARYGIGYAPDGWQSLQSVFTDYAGRALKEAGLVIDAEGGRRYDRFRDRIMFPILDQRGAVIGFGGRVLGAGEPKYLNSPETPLFEKGRELYGLSQARNAIRATGRALVVEGYMDVVALAQHGIDNAVATLGTATSAVHIQKLFRQTGEIAFCFDGDAAGRRAAWHALEVSLPLLADDKGVRFLFLPPEDDPDSYVRTRGAAAFEEALAQARPLSEFLLAELRSRVDMSTMEGRSRLIAESKPLLKRVAAPALQIQLARQLADAAGMPVQDVARLTEVRLFAAPRQVASVAGPERAERRPSQSLEQWILKRLMVSPRLSARIPLEFIDPGSPDAEVLLAFIDFALAAPEAGFEPQFIEHFKGTRFERVFNNLRSELLVLNFLPEQVEADLAEALPRIEQQHVRRRLEALQSSQPGPQRNDELRELMQRLRELDNVEKKAT